MIGIEEKFNIVQGIFSYLDAGGEQTVFEITGISKKFVTGIMVDMTNFTQNGTFKFYSKIDGTNYRELQVPQTFTVATSKKGVILAANFNFNFPVDEALKITYTEGGDEGADRAMPYKYTLQ